MFVLEETSTLMFKRNWNMVLTMLIRDLMRILTYIAVFYFDLGSDVKHKGASLLLWNWTLENQTPGKNKGLFLDVFHKNNNWKHAKKHKKCTRLSYSAGDKKPLTIVVQLDLLGLGR